MDSLLTIGDVTKIFQVSPRTIYRMVHEGEIRSVKIRGCVRFKERDIEVLVARNTKTRKYKSVG